MSVGVCYSGNPRMVDWSSQPDLALSGVGAHSVHGHEDQWCPHPPFDGGERIWVAERSG